MWFLALCIFARLFWKAHETLVKQPQTCQCHVRWPRVYVYSATTMWKSSDMILFGMYHCYSSYLQRSYGPVDIIPINAILVHSDMNIERCAVSIPSVLISGQSNRQSWTSCEYCFRLKKIIMKPSRLAFKTWSTKWGRYHLGTLANVMPVH